MKYKSGLPFFDNKDINYILEIYRKILKGNGTLRMGKYVKRFENQFAKYIGVKHSISTTSCTTALETIFNSLNLDKKSEIIIPCQSYISTASTIIRCGAKPIIIEIDKNYNLDFEDLKRKINKNTKAVVIVHFGGCISEKIFEIKKFLKSKKIILVEDAAHSLGASYNNIKAGNLGDISAFSFYSTKMITTGEGGMIATNNKILAKKCAQFRSRGLKLNSKNEVYSQLGTNFRMTEFQAILGLVQLNKINKFVKHRNSIAKLYNKILSQNLDDIDVILPSINTNSTNAFWRYIVVLNKKQKRSKKISKLRSLSIDAIYSYQPLLHKQLIIKKIFKKKLSLVNSEKYCARHIMLPIHYKISKKDATFIANTLSKIIKINK